MGEEQVAAMTSTLDMGSLLTVASDIFGAVLGLGSNLLLLVTLALFMALVTNSLPDIGFVVGVIPPAIIGLLEGGPGLMLGVLAVYSVINVVIQWIIQPRYVGDAVGLTPTITMLSPVFWTWVIGPLGALLAVPLSLLMRALLIEADRGARWSMPLISDRASDREPVAGEA